ncbi:MAG: hypothetical protein GY795_43105 [Desulfobacterales bacterium]|nr:hypothetical protein [Desulfobacterales bacterium]
MTEENENMKDPAQDQANEPEDNQKDDAEKAAAEASKKKKFQPAKMTVVANICIVTGNKEVVPGDEVSLPRKEAEDLIDRGFASKKAKK